MHQLETSDLMYHESNKNQKVKQYIYKLYQYILFTFAGNVLSDLLSLTIGNRIKSYLQLNQLNMRKSILTFPVENTIKIEDIKI